jgi:hypothetical protein
LAALEKSICFLFCSPLEFDGVVDTRMHILISTSGDGLRIYWRWWAVQLWYGGHAWHFGAFWCSSICVLFCSLGVGGLVSAQREWRIFPKSFQGVFSFCLIMSLFFLGRWGGVFRRLNANQIYLMNDGYLCFGCAAWRLRCLLGSVGHYGV